MNPDLAARLHRVFGSRYIRNVLTLLTGTALAQAIPIAVTPILTRLYTPDEFGEFALYISVISLGAIAATGRYEIAIPLPKTEKGALSLVALSLLTAVVISLFAFIIVALFGREINGLLGINKASQLVLLIPLGILIVACFQIFSYWTIYRARFRHLALGKISAAGGIVSAQLALASLAQHWGLLMGQILGQAIGAFALFAGSVHRDIVRLGNSLSWQSLRHVAATYRKFPLLSLPADLINSLASQVPLILLGSFFGTGVVGLFALTQRVLWAPVALLGISVQDVFKERASRDYRETGSCRDIYLKTLKTLALLALIPIALLFITAPDLFSWFFGAEWREAGEYARLLIGLYYMRFISSPLSYVIYIANKQQYDLIWQIVLLLLTTASVVVGGFVESPQLSIGLFAASYAVMYLVYLAMSYRFSTNRINT